MVALSLFWALLLLLRSPLVEAASNFHLRNHTGLQFLYDFKAGYRGEETSGSVVDSTGKNLLGNLTTGSIGTGIRHSADPTTSGVSIRAQSQQLSGDLLAQLSSDFTLEFFFNSPGNQGSTFLRIAGFGDWPPGVPFARCSPNDTTVFGGWHLYSGLASAIIFEGVVLSNGLPYCTSVGVSIQVLTLRHLVARSRNGVVQIYSQGASQSDPNVQEFDPSLWARHPAPLTIASPHADVGWTGTMYMVAMYDRFLSTTEIIANQGFGPPNSFPEVSTTAATVLEDSSVDLYP